MKPREHRQTIRVTARMKTASGWQDVAIQNASAHGLKISAAFPMRRGECIELRRASQIIVARVMWAEGGHYGVRTQDTVDIPALIAPNAGKAEIAIASVRSDRRGAPRVQDRAARSRAFAAQFQWLAIIAALVLGAGYAAWTAFEALSEPLGAISGALGGVDTRPQLNAPG